ncbi:MAG TPA: cytochrome P450 [Stellaceae bacterium]|nr:cytochrome P450 [Stellaceae bacterium]
MEDTKGATAPAVTVRATWRALGAALGGNALAAFPREAFEEEVVIHRLLGHRQIIFNRPEAIRHVLIENAGNYRRPAPTVRVLQPIFGGGLFLSAGAEWRRQRRMAAPAFAPRAVGILARHVAAAADSLVAELTTRNGRPIDLVPVLQRLALDIIGSAVFSLEMAHYAAPMRELILHYARHLGRPSLSDYVLPLAVPSPRDLARRRFRRRWTALVADIIAERRRSGAAEHRDLFDLLCETDGSEGKASERLCDQVATIVVAGHETTAAALFWSLYLLSCNPGVQERIAAEAGRLDLGPEGAAAAVPYLVHTRAVVDESLRLYPPAFVIVREAAAADVAGGVAVPAGALVLVAPWTLHRHRRLWRDPETFDPSRFAPGAPPPEKFSYMPFGAGPRTCIGAPFALTELVLILAVLARSFHIETAEPDRVRPKALVTIQPENPPLFRLRCRAAPVQAAGSSVFHPPQIAAE